jgi:hypothetical protein
LLEIPTGSKSAGLGSGHVQAFLPVWLQKSVGDWMIYGGGGYGLNPGAGNEDYGYGGVVVQRQVMKNVLLGAEIYHRTTLTTGGRADTAFNLGTVIDFTEHQHLLLSVGRSTARRTFKSMSPGNSPSARNLSIRLATGSASGEKSQRDLIIQRGVGVVWRFFPFGVFAHTSCKLTLA